MSAPAATKAQRVFDEEFIGRNFNTAPLTISNLRGDLYDYELAFFAKNGNLADQVTLDPNGDAGATKRNYRMSGASSSAEAFTNDSYSYIWIVASGPNVRPSLCRIRITGKSGSERLFDTFSSRGETTSQVDKYSQYWKNTGDEITSLVIRNLNNATMDAHVVLFATPKDSAQEEWELIDTLLWSSESATKDFTGLNGDVDGQYRVSWSGSQSLDIAINGDTNPNYTIQEMRNSGGSISANNSTTQTSIVTLGNEVEVLIDALSGQERLSTSTSSSTSSTQQSERAHWWSNTGDNITSLSCQPTAPTTATAHLYRKRTPNKSSDTLPWETIGEVAVSGDFSSGHTFSGLEGDKEFLYRLEWLGVGDAGSLGVAFNGDEGANYARQELQALTSTVSASFTSSETYLFLTNSQTDTHDGQLLIYPKSGEQRPALGSYRRAGNRVNIGAHWWGNTADEITSIRLRSSNTNPITGTLRLSRIPRTQP